MEINLQQIINQLQNIFTVYGIRIIAAVVILIVGRILASIVKSIAKKAATNKATDTTVTTFVGNIAYMSIMIFATIAALGKLGVQTTSFVAVIGAAGLAVGLAFQGSLSNFASGFLMVLFRPFKVGDFIEGAGIAGEVKDIHIFTTTIITPDNKKIIVPNSQLTGNNIINFTAEPVRRIDLVVGVSYNDDIDNVKEVLKDEISKFKDILDEPETQIAVSELADSSVNFVVRPWVKTADYWSVKFGLLEAIKKRFDKENISIPFPQSDIHIKQK